MLLGLYLFLVIALPLALGLVVAIRGLPRSRLCSFCLGETIRLRSWPHRAASRLLRSDELHARWCPSCGWKGTIRTARPEPAPLARQIPAESIPPGLEIRRVQLDDGPWRVRLECWAEEGQWNGRLLYVGPEGRAWTDGRPLLTGRSALEVLSQVLVLSDRALVGRIRKATR